MQFMGRNINEVYALAMNSMKHNHNGWVARHPSRNGDMLEFYSPVMSKYLKPQERVLFDPIRDCNPFLHFFESLWMLAGREDLAFLSQFTKNFENFSDDGIVLNGAYGRRWRNWRGLNQIELAIEELQENPNSRRVVTQMWDAEVDLRSSSKDVPCNTAIFWKLRNGALDMTVTNRSNDAIWGAYGANVVHFSMLQEYVARSVGVKVGTYYQISNSLHIYPELPIAQRIWDKHIDIKACPYELGEVAAFPLMWGPNAKEQFDEDLRWFFRMDPDFDDYGTTFFSDVVMPMWRVFKDRTAPTEDIAATDWRRAVEEWMERRGQR